MHGQVDTGLLLLNDTKSNTPYLLAVHHRHDQCAVLTVGNMILLPFLYTTRSRPTAGCSTFKTNDTLHENPVLYNGTMTGSIIH